MKSYQITVNNQEYTVEVDNPNVSPVTVRVNGKTFKVTLTPQTARMQSAPAPDQGAEAEEPYVPVFTTTYVDTAADVEPEARAPASSTASGEVKEKIIAPMPGKIMDIAVRVGDRIKSGDTLCNLEAMKMKSPIRSTTEGTIAQVLISEGQNVNYGDILFTLR